MSEGDVYPYRKIERKCFRFPIASINQTLKLGYHPRMENLSPFALTMPLLFCRYTNHDKFIYRRRHTQVSQTLLALNTEVFRRSSPT